MLRSPSSTALHKQYSPSQMPTILAIVSVPFTAALGLVLEAKGLGPLVPYAPVLCSVLAATWFGGLWASLLTQVLGGAIILFGSSGVSLGALLQRSPLQFAFQAADVYALVAFLVAAKLCMFGLLTHRRNRELMRQAERFELIAAATHDCIYEWDIPLDVVWRGGKLTELYGVRPEEVTPTIAWWRCRVHAHDDARVWNDLQNTLQSPAKEWRQEYRLRHNNGHYLTVSDQAVIVRDRSGKAVRLMGGLIDVSDQRRTEQRLVHNALHDALTGLPNRELFLDRLQTALSTQHSAEPAGAKVAVLFLDVDRFKVVNDSLGHATGDELLVALADRLQRVLKPGDTAARFGGDEFTLLIQNIPDAAAAEKAAERILQALAHPFIFEVQPITISASIGVAIATPGQERPEEIVRRADIAMYRAKAAGRAGYQLFDPAFDAHARNRLYRESELRQSFQDNSLRLYYQPIISIESGRTVSFEALLRWQHPTRGLVMPGEILPLAEEAGLARNIGQWVLRESCRQIREWRDASWAPPNLSLSFNLSGADIMRPSLVDDVASLLKEYDIDGSALLIELTETTIMEGDHVASDTMSELRKLGVRLALDDFGRGYSSLGRLQDLPISMLKVDSSFVDQIGGPKQKILDAVLALAHGLEIDVTAEGVETLKQLLFLVQSGTARVQGLLFSDALPVERASELLQQVGTWPIFDQIHSRVHQVSAS